MARGDDEDKLMHRLRRGGISRSATETLIEELDALKSRIDELEKAQESNPS